MLLINNEGKKENRHDFAEVFYLIRVSRASNLNMLAYKELVYDIHRTFFCTLPLRQSSDL